MARFPKNSKIVIDILLLIVLAVLISLIMLNSDQKVFSFRNDAADYASIARNLVRGRGLHSDIIYPLSFSFPFLRKIPQPLVHRSPLYPIVLAGFFSITSIADQNIKLLGILFYVFTVPLVYLLANNLFNRPVAVSSTLLTVINPHLFLAVTSGLTELMTCFLFALLLFFLFKKHRLLDTIVCGFVLGLLYLTRNYFLLALPAVTYYVYKKNKGHVGYFIAVFLAVISPWLIRNYLLTGNPLFMLQDYAQTGKTIGVENAFLIAKPFSLLHILKYYPRELIQGLFKYYYQLFEFPRSLLIYKFNNVLFLINPLLLFFVFYKNRLLLEKELRDFLIILVGCLILPFGIYSTPYRLLYFLIPLLTILGTDKFLAVFPLSGGKAKDKYLWCLLGVVSLLMAYLLYLELSRWNQKWNNYEDKWQLAYTKISSAMKKEKLVVVDSVSDYAWYADQPALYLPANIETLKLYQENIKFNYLGLFERTSFSAEVLKVFRSLAEKQPENITITSPSAGRYIIYWKKFPFAHN